MHNRTRFGFVESGKRFTNFYNYAIWCVINIEINAGKIHYGIWPAFYLEKGVT